MAIFVLTARRPLLNMQTALDRGREQLGYRELPFVMQPDPGRVFGQPTPWRVAPPLGLFGHPSLAGAPTFRRPSPRLFQFCFATPPLRPVRQRTARGCPI